MSFTISPFDTSFLNQLTNLPPDEWQTNAYELFLHNEWHPWFFPFQAVSENQLVGFGMFFIFEEFAWLGWILVHKDYRRVGIGTAITAHLLDKASEKGAKGFILTATEMGKPIYEKLGFKTTSLYRFFKMPEIFKPKYDRTIIRKANQNDLSKILELDFQATGEIRFTFIENRIDECLVYDNGVISGFYIPELGNGFIVANDNQAGIELLNFRCDNNKTVIVVPEQNKSAVDYLLQNNFTEGYSVPRMILGKEPEWKPEMIYNRASGYCG
jgi:GNAT superfamily N-acetyltransferase